MKPHQLRIEAFGPYAEPTEIGFDALSDEGLFLIHGTTGAGKTFLLDALCFALYGEVSGDRNLRALKSDHAEPAAVPRVSLEFSCGGLRYLVERSPAYVAPKSRGKGVTEKVAQAALFRLTAGERQPMASRSTEVSREVERLVGLSAAQFRQVILLPQGKFAEVLRARADEREALLKTLFDTVVFEQAGVWLEEQAKAARLDLAEQQRSQEVLRRQILQAWSAFAPVAAAGSSQEAAPAPEPGSGSDPQDLDQQADLDHVHGQMAMVLAATTQRLQQAMAALETAQAAKAAIDRQADRWDRRAAAASRLQELEAKQAVVDDYRQRLRRAERAEALRGSLEAEAAAQLQLQQVTARLQALLLTASRARDQAPALPAAVLEINLQSLPSQEALGEASSALAARRAEVMALLRKAQEATEARTAAEQGNRLAAAAQATITSTTAALEVGQRQRQQVGEALQRACSARDQLDGLERAAREATETVRAVAAITAAEQRQGEQRAAQARADAELQRAEAVLRQRRQEMIAGMASQLASELAEGDPCPVCGSSQHPSPAQPVAAAVNAAAIQAAEDNLRQASARGRQVAADLATAQAELKALLDKAGGAALDPQAAVTAAHEASKALSAAQALAKDAGSLQERLQIEEAGLNSLQLRLQQAIMEQALQAQTAAASTQQAQKLLAEIAAELGVGLDPQAALAGFQPVEQALKALTTGAQEISAATTTLHQASGRLLRELAATEFADASAVRLALKEASWRTDLAGRIEAFDKGLIEVRALLASADLVELPLERPDAAAALEALAQADAVRTSAVERQTEARAAHAEIGRLLEDHRQGAVVQEERQQRARLLSAVADRCQGRAAPFISLQRWVLSAYLAEICRYANGRLESMTSGRYQLRLTDEGGRGGRNAGLGLRVLDAYTGEEREVSSLSGGETFQASLALALGVADTVQAHAGGVHLDALFIDEGFGTLDPDNLQLAMDELDRLRDGGRMIGVISHVGALKERIRAGIAITATETGSRAMVCRTASD